MNNQLPDEWKHFRRAEELISIERWREAIAELHHYLQLEPESSRALGLIAQCYYELAAQLLFRQMDIYRVGSNLAAPKDGRVR